MKSALPLVILLALGLSACSKSGEKPSDDTSQEQKKQNEDEKTPAKLQARLQLLVPEFRKTGLNTDEKKVLLQAITDLRVDWEAVRCEFTNDVGVVVSSDDVLTALTDKEEELTREITTGGTPTLRRLWEKFQALQKRSVSTKVEAEDLIAEMEEVQEEAYKIDPTRLSDLTKFIFKDGNDLINNLKMQFGLLKQTPQERLGELSNTVVTSKAEADDLIVKYEEVKAEVTAEVPQTQETQDMIQCCDDSIAELRKIQ